MKEIKAYIRSSCVEQTVEGLKKKGAPGITIVTVHPVGYGFSSRFSMREEELTKKFYDITKIEMVCDNEDLDSFINVILESAQTGSQGDGLVFVSDVHEVIRIRTRERAFRIDGVAGPRSQ